MSPKVKRLSVEPIIRLYLGRRFVFGPGKAALLEQIARTGSISEAAKAMAMSYMKAWKLVHSLDRGFAEPLVLKRRGGSARGGATLSATGQQVLTLYREMATVARCAVRRPGTRFTRLLK